jgi:hypothetical protein
MALIKAIRAEKRIIRIFFIIILPKMKMVMKVRKKEGYLMQFYKCNRGRLSILKIMKKKNYRIIMINILM